VFRGKEEVAKDGESVCHTHRTIPTIWFHNYTYLASFGFSLQRCLKASTKRWNSSIVNWQGFVSGFTCANSRKRTLISSLEGLGNKVLGQKLVQIKFLKVRIGLKLLSKIFGLLCTSKAFFLTKSEHLPDNSLNKTEIFIDYWLYFWSQSNYTNINIRWWNKSRSYKFFFFLTFAVIN
jgi:hypothetical protein